MARAWLGMLIEKLRAFISVRWTSMVIVVIIKNVAF